MRPYAGLGAHRSEQFSTGVALALSDVTTGSDSVAGTNHTVALPGGCTSAHRLIAIIARSGGTVSWPAGWTEIFDTTGGSGTQGLAVAYRNCDGSEGASINVTTSASVSAAWAVYRLTGWNAASTPEITAFASGTSANPNPPSINPSWGAVTSAFIAAYLSRTAVAGVPNTTLAYPANYTTGQVDVGATGANPTNVGAALRITAAASEDPGTFTLSASDDWDAVTIAVRGA